ncbi:hypothetical protein [Demequina mangrovi]|uniref:Cell division inhibitor SulA, prevents FtsZ ring assembly n=1 Tax=Demequina mangrovi TaxID=1043493 RepID=A0A1H6UQY8_9MICO|nr:hypothetical protein [Demequina mangrovi]SEI94691.1 Cell division inhibitor SulA, prevents FtsZ ring assembly [Demequina mangrovi]
MGRPAWVTMPRTGARRMGALALATIIVALALSTLVLPGAAAAPPAGTAEAAEEYPAPPPAAVRLLWAFSLSGADGADLAGGTLHRGDSLTVAATGLPPGARVEVELHSTPLPMGATTVAADGGLTLVAVVPEAAEAGAHEVVATLTGDGIEPSTATAAVTIAEALPAIAPAPILVEVLDAAPLPTPEPSASPAAEAPPAPAAAPDPVAAPEPEAVAVAEPEPADGYPWLAPTIPTLGDLELSPLRIAAAFTLASAFLLLAGIPAELLQSTLTENYSRAFGWLTPRRRGARRRSRLARALGRPWIACGITVALATLILGLGQTGFRFGPEEAITYVSLWLSLTVLNLGLNGGRLLAARRGARAPGRLTPLPGALIVVTISVVVSETLHIEPALLFGVVVSVQYGRSISSRYEGRLALLGVGTAFAVGVLSWLALSALESVFAGSDGVAVTLVEETLAGIVLETLAALVVGLLPFTYLDGKAIHDWSRRAWGAAYFVAAVAFVLIAVPTGNDWQSSQTPLLTWLLIVAGFGAIALSAWAAFRFIPERRPEPSSPEADPTPPVPAASSPDA